MADRDKINQYKSIKYSQEKMESDKQKQFFLLEALAEDTEKQQQLLDENLHVKVMLEAAREDIEKLKKDVEKLKDATRDIKFSNGNGNGH